MVIKIAPGFVFDVYQAVFGYQAVPYPDAHARFATKRTQDAAERLSDSGAVLYRREANGSEAFCPVDLYHPGTKRTFALPYSTISVSLHKTIVRTDMPGRRGTVKEMIQIDDLDINIQGVILGSDLPEKELRELNDLFEINEPLKLKSAFAELFMPSDNTIVIESMDFPDMRGITGAQAYSMKLTSDSILELEEQ